MGKPTMGKPTMGKPTMGKPTMGKPIRRLSVQPLLFPQVQFCQLSNFLKHIGSFFTANFYVHKKPSVMEEWFNDSTSIHFTSRESQPLEDKPSCSSSDLMAHWTEDPLNHLSIPTDSGFSMTYKPPLMLHKDLLSYNGAPVSTSCNSLDDKIFEPKSATQLGNGGVRCGAQMMDVNYNNYAERRNTTSPSFSPDINPLKVVPINTPPPLEQAMIFQAMIIPTDMVIQKQGYESQYCCWKHGCEGRTFSSSATFWRHLREQEGRGRKWDSTKDTAAKFAGENPAKDDTKDPAKDYAKDNTKDNAKDNALSI
ncbi:uncharacterized protein BP5553_02655 [Venustampulla echinocandica]|uniref:Uncharacterized protein n=1 Tax=Venustampulla echinocandica TaxID=2656787 RepID=A0A370TRZ9_9HELO|nr:uncharacterized protein BP5553_02655 [Venustampulla echinocandica]RDL38315.1 hypothetical protein BP5553_02655 [Venustampulla echinocandica]